MHLRPVWCFSIRPSLPWCQTLFPPEPCGSFSWLTRVELEALLQHKHQQVRTGLPAHRRLAMWRCRNNGKKICILFFIPKVYARFTLNQGQIYASFRKFQLLPDLDTGELRESELDENSIEGYLKYICWNNIYTLKNHFSICDLWYLHVSHWKYVHQPIIPPTHKSIK